MPGGDRAPDVAFVSHQANRTGAPAVLLELVREAVANDLRCRVLLLEDGPLRADFEALAPTELVDWASFGRPVWVKVAGRLGLGGRASALNRRKARRALQWVVDARVVHLNSVECVRLLPLLPARPRVLVTHVHELRNGIDLAVVGEWDVLAQATHRFIAAAAAVARELERRGVDASAIDICHEFIRLDRFEPRPPTTTRDRPLVVAVGSISTRKGADLFVQTALQLRLQRPDLEVEFRWIGSPLHEPDASRWMRHDIAASGLTDVIDLVGEVDDPRALLEEADVFVLPSREDPFPVACLEAAALGLPIAAFDCGGMKELLDGAALFVPLPRTDLLADAVARLLDDRALAEELGMNARTRVSDMGAEQGAQRVLAVLRRHLP